jgi:putative endonuclease
MSRASACYVYILASGRHGTLYIGITNDLRTRLEQHRNGRGSEFVKKYRVHRLVHVETFASPLESRRTRETAEELAPRLEGLIEENNLDWSDLSHLL